MVGVTCTARAAELPPAVLPAFTGISPRRCNWRLHSSHPQLPGASGSSQGSVARQRLHRQHGQPSGRRGSSCRVAAAAAGTPDCVALSDRSSQQAQSQLEIKVVGIGGRGASAIRRLVRHGQMRGAELWCLDTDPATLDTLPTPNTLVLPKERSPSLAAVPEAGKLSAADLRRIAGGAAVVGSRTGTPSSNRGSGSNCTSGQSGSHTSIAFVVAPAAAAPGGGATVVQLAAALRAAGHLVVAALTQPFSFEGAAKRQQASELVAALQGSAHLVAVMEQEVLMQAFGGAQMTMAQATDIADTALEHAVLSVLQAVQAGEVLVRGSGGTLTWQPSASPEPPSPSPLAAPPIALQQLLGGAAAAQGGVAVVGRGMASMPGEAAHAMDAAEALMHLASDAVSAAAESPFLEGALEGAAGLLCCLRVPAADQLFSGGGGASLAPLQGLQTPEGARRAARLAAQAAAGALGSLCSTDAGAAAAACQFAVCVEPRQAPPADSGSSGGGFAPSGGVARAGSELVQVEASLVVLRGAAGVARASSLAAGSGRSGTAAGGRRYDEAAPTVPQPPAQRQSPRQRLPASSWSMLSAMAGGGRVAQRERQEQESSDDGQQQQQPRQEQSGGAGDTGASSIAGQHHQQGRQPNTSAAADPRQPPARRVPVQRPERLLRQGVGSRPAAVAGGHQQQSQAEQQELGQEQGLDEPAARGGVSVGDYLLNSLTAQSLDLPPAAARWRQEQRAGAQRQRRLIVWEVDEAEPWEEVEEEAAGGLAALLPLRRPQQRRVKLRQRMESILMQDREDTWQAEQQGWPAVDD